MGEAILFLLTSFWLGAVHAATPGHGKTIAASYIVGVRGRPVDALVLGIFVTLSHISGIVLVAVLAVAGSTLADSSAHRGISRDRNGGPRHCNRIWMLKSQMRVLATSRMHLSESSVADSAQAIGTTPGILIHRTGMRTIFPTDMRTNITVDPLP